jgi:hypothetical protein
MTEVLVGHLPWPLHTPPTASCEGQVLGTCWVVTQRLEASQGIDFKALPLSPRRLLGVWSRNGPERERRSLSDDEKAWGRSSPACCPQRLTGKHWSRADDRDVFA